MHRSGMNGPQVVSIIGQIFAINDVRLGFDGIEAQVATTVITSGCGPIADEEWVPIRADMALSVDICHRALSRLN